MGDLCIVREGETDVGGEEDDGGREEGGGDGGEMGGGVGSDCSVSKTRQGQLKFRLQETSEGRL